MATKDTGLRIRIEKELREEFLKACSANDQPAAQVLRQFMRDYVKNHQLSRQRSLFDEQPMGRI
jgi:hypothetical protein